MEPGQDDDFNLADAVTTTSLGQDDDFDINDAVPSQELSAEPSTLDRIKSAGKAAATVAGGMGEAALSKASQWVAPMVALPGQAIGELAGAISEGKTPQDVADSINMENARGFMERVGEASQEKTYQPQGEVGQGAVENFNEKIESVREPILDKVAEGAVKAGLPDEAAGFAVSAADNTMMAAAYGLAGAPARVGAALERAVGAPKIKIGDVTGVKGRAGPTVEPTATADFDLADAVPSEDWSAYPEQQAPVREPHTPEELERLAQSYDRAAETQRDYQQRSQYEANAHALRQGAQPWEVPYPPPEVAERPQGEAAQPISVRPTDEAKLREEIAALRAEVPSGTPVMADSPLGKEITGLKQRWQDAGLSPEEFYAIKPAEAAPAGAAESPASAEPKAAPEAPAAAAPPVEVPTKPYAPLADDERTVAAQAAGIAPEAVDHDAVSALVHLIETDPATAQRMLDDHPTSEALSAAVREHLAAKQHADEAGNDGESGGQPPTEQAPSAVGEPEQARRRVGSQDQTAEAETVAPQEAPDASRINEATSAIRSDQGERSQKRQAAGEGEADRSGNVQQPPETGASASREPSVSQQETQAGAWPEHDVAKARRGTDARDTGHTPETIRKILVDKFNAKGIANLERSGVLKIVRSAEDLPAGARQGMTGTEDGVYHDGVAYLIANRLHEGSAERVALHEIGEHWGLEKMLGTEAYSRLLGEVRKWRNIRSPAVTEAWDAVKRAYPELDEADHTFVREVIAKLGESAAGRKTTVWKQIVQAIKQFFFKHGLPVNLSEEDIAGLVRRSLWRAMKDERGGPDVTPQMRDSAMRGQPLFSRISEEGKRLHAVKNEMVDEERAARGLPPIIGLAKESQGQWWDEAMRKMDENPLADRELVASLIDKPRGVDPVESALLLHRRINLQNDYHKALALIDSGDEAKSQEYSLRVAKLEDDLDTLDAVSRGVGTEAGRALAVRKMLADEDYNVASMATAFRAAKGGEALTPKDREKIAIHQNRIERTRKVVEEVEAKSEERAAKQQAADVVQDLVQKAKQARGKAERRDTDAEKKAILAGIKHAVSESQKRMAADAVAKNAERGWKVPEAAVNKLASIFSAAKKTAKALFSRGDRAVNESVDEAIYTQVRPEFETYLKAAQDAGASVKDFTAGIVEQFGKDSVPYLAHFIKEKGLAAEIAPVRELKAPQRTQLSELGGYVQKLADAFVREGVTKLDPLVDKVHAELKRIVPDITRRQTMDAISGYGEFSKLNPDSVKVVLRDLKGQAQQMAKLADMEAGRPPKKTGVERRVPSDEERRLIKQVNEAKRRFKVQATDPAKQLKSALDAIKTRLHNQIRDLDYQIATGIKTVKTHAEVPLDAAAKALRDQRDALREQYDAIFKKPGMTDEQRIAAATRAVRDSIETYEKRIASGDTSPLKKAASVSTPALDALRAERDALRAEFDELRDLANPKAMPEERALQSAKRAVARSTERYQTMLADRQFETPPRKPSYTPDPAIDQARAANIAAKKDWMRAKLEERLKRRVWWVKHADTFNRWHRGFLLSSPVVLAKLTAAAITRLASAHVEEGIGGAYSAILPSLADRAPREGGLNVKAEAKAFTDGFVHYLKHSKDYLAKRGESTMEQLYGRGREGAIGEMDVMTKSIIDWFGILHGALKAPVKMAEFGRSYEKRMAWQIRNGADGTSPAVQTAVAIEAWKDANRSIFLNDNMIVDAYKWGIRRFEQPDADTGQPTVGGKIASTTLQTLLPIVRVPTNIVAETMQYALGLVSGGSRLLGAALGKGIKKLPPDKADLIMREIKKGTIGGALLVTGYLLSDQIGGYYQPGKRDDKDVKFGRIRIGGVNVPSFLLHSPLLETLQIGATIARVSHAALDRDGGTKGLPAGVKAAAWGVTEEVPFVKEMLELGKLKEEKSADQFFDELAKNIVVPQAIQWAAARADVPEGESHLTGEAIKRKPQGLSETIKSGIPGLRESIPVLPTQRPPNDWEGSIWQYSVQKAPLDKLTEAWKGMTKEQREEALPLIMDKIDRRIDHAKTPEETDRADALRDKFQISAQSNH